MVIGKKPGQASTLTHLILVPKTTQVHITIRTVKNLKILGEKKKNQKNFKTLSSANLADQERLWVFVSDCFYRGKKS